MMANQNSLRVPMNYHMLITSIGFELHFEESFYDRTVDNCINGEPNMNPIVFHMELQVFFVKE